MISWTPDAIGKKCQAVITLVRSFIRDEAGATAVEYGLLVTLCSLAAGSVVAILGQIAQVVYNFILNNVVAAANGPAS